MAGDTVLKLYLEKEIKKQFQETVFDNAISLDQ